MFNRWVEDGLLEVLQEKGLGCIAFSPLAQGLLTEKYLEGIPADSRAAKPKAYLRRENVTEDKLAKVRKLKALAQQRGQSVAQMAIAWVLRHASMTSALIGASRVSQIEEIVATLDKLEFTNEELKTIDRILLE
jgi:L-glyceraldehyde 3-phosphate reductase